MTTNFSDKDFFEIQEKLYKWIQVKKVVNWGQIHRVCLHLLESFDNEYINKYGNYPEYKIFMPLLRNGYCEITIDSNKLYFVPLYKNESDINSINTFDPLIVLNNFPELTRIIDTYKTEKAIDLKYRCDLYDSYSYKSFDVFSKKIGIYKLKNEVRSPAYFYTGAVIKQIPAYNRNIDAINIARCATRVSNSSYQYFIYNENKQLLFCTNYSELPILITRALLLFDKDQLFDKRFYYPLSIEIPYKNIPPKAVYELKRIFGENSVGKSND